MASTKLPDELDLESLISALNNDDTNEKLEDNDVVSFLTHYNIKPGTHCTTIKLLYDLYKLWTLTPVSKEQFGNVVRRFIPIDNKYYYINFTSLKVSSTVYKILNKRDLDRSKSFRFQKHFENFISKFNLNPGDNWIHANYIYYLYDIWTHKIQKTTPMRKDTLSEFLNMYFKRRITSKGYHYGFTDSIFEHLTPEVVAEIDEGVRYKSEKRKKAKEKKDKSKNEK